MNIWQVNKNAKNRAQVSFGIPEHELDSFNAYARAIQEENAQIFSSGFDFIKALIDQNKNIAAGENQLSTYQQEIHSLLEENNSLKNRITELESTLDTHQSSTIEQSQEKDALNDKILDLESQLTSTLEENDQLKASAFSLAENQILLTVHPIFKHLMTMISERRFKAGDDKTQNSLQEQIFHLIIQKQTIFNRAGEYETHIEYDEFMKILQQFKNQNQ